MLRTLLRTRRGQIKNCQQVQHCIFLQPGKYKTMSNFFLVITKVTTKDRHKHRCTHSRTHEREMEKDIWVIHKPWHSDRGL